MNLRIACREPITEFLLCYERCLVHIEFNNHFSPADWQLTPEQVRRVGEIFKG